MNEASSSLNAPMPEVFAAWLQASHDLLALTDVQGRIAWSNAAFHSASGLGKDDNLLALAPDDWHAGEARRTLLAALTQAAPGGLDLALRTPAGTALWVHAHVTRVAETWLWTLRDTTTERALAERARQLSELLEMAQEFGRLGVWEREIPSGRGRWDRHVFSFFGMEPTADTPDFAVAALRIHPDDRLDQAYADSTQRAGRYTSRYRVVQPDGGVRWNHSQWEVKNSPQGRPDRTVGIMVDDTAVYELARSLDSATRQLSLATELADIVIWRHDLRTQRVHYNDHGLKVLGIPHRPEGVTLDEARMHAHPDDLAMLAASAAQALTSNSPVDVEARHQRADGSWRRMLIRRVVERSPSGEALAFLGVTLDVTEQQHCRQMNQAP